MEEKTYEKVKSVEEMQKRICQMMDHTWSAIGGDVLACMGIDDRSGKTISRATVIEMVCDADRMAMYGDDPEAYEVYKTLSPKSKKIVALQAFPHKKYGW